MKHNKKSDINMSNKLVKHLVSVAQGCFLYVKLILDLIEKGNLVIKSASFKVESCIDCNLIQKSSFRSCHKL